VDAVFGVLIHWDLLVIEVGWFSFYTLALYGYGPGNSGRWKRPQVAADKGL